MTRGEETLEDIGEAGILARIFGRLAAAEGVLIGPGDDAAALAAPDEDTLLFASDAMVESVHFDLAFMTPADVGWRLTCANLSDLAAMGAAPQAAVVSIAAPAATPASVIEEFYAGAGALARREGLALVGGDVVASPAALFFSMAVLGRAARGQILTRAGAAAGEALMLSGELARARAGWDILTGAGECGPAAAGDAVTAYRRPTPRLALARALAAAGLATAALDTSDSLAESVRHLARASAVGITVDAAALPIAPAARHVAAFRREDATSYALAAGEDFELLFACPRAKVNAARAAARAHGVPLSVIGRITSERGRVCLAAAGGERPLPAAGFAHF